jgi:hypothetical protein
MIIRGLDLQRRVRLGFAVFLCHAFLFQCIEAWPPAPGSFLASKNDKKNIRTETIPKSQYTST